MPRMGGLELLRALKDQLTDLTFILLTAQGTVETAVEAIKEGAYDYLTKPVDPQRLQILLAEGRRAAGDAARGEGAAPPAARAGQLRPDHRQQPGDARRSTSVIEQAAPTSASVLITGESGTGKELVAQTIHQLSPRAAFPFVADQLRRDSRDAARERDLRPREGRVHRRRRSPARAASSSPIAARCSSTRSPR